MKAYRLRRAPALAFLLVLVLTPDAASAGKPLIDRQTTERVARGVGLLQSIGQSFQQEQALSPLERQRRAYGVIGPSSLDQPLGRVLETIRRAAGQGAPEARIHVTPDPGLHAFAAEDGAIFIAVGMLRSLETEDELAALIAHEYAHVLRGHTGRTALQQARDIGAGLSALYMDYEYGDGAARRSRPETEFVRHALLREAAMHSVQSGIVPNRARGQEDEADRIGTDLLVTAGYSPVGMIDMLGRLDAWEEQRRAAAASAEQDIAHTGVAATAVRYAERSDQARSARRKLEGDRGNLVNALISTMVSGTRARVRDAGRSHRASDERIAQVLEHLERTQASGPRPDMRPLPWASDAAAASLFSSIDLVHALLGNNDARLGRPAREQMVALQSLSGSPAGQTPLGRYVMLRYLASPLGSDDGMAAWHGELTRADSLFAAHRLVLDLSNRLSAEPAVTMFETSTRSLADPPELLPYGIRIHRRAGNTATAEQYAARCRGSGNELLRDACAKAR